MPNARDTALATGMGAASGATAGPVGAVVGGGMGLLGSMLGKGGSQKPVDQKTAMPNAQVQPLTKTAVGRNLPTGSTLEMPTQKSYALNMLQYK